MRGSSLEFIFAENLEISCLVSRDCLKYGPQKLLASILGRIAEGPNVGQRVKTAGNFTDEESVDESFESGSSRCAMVSRFSVHAGVGIPAGRHEDLERLCKYAARPRLAMDRLSQLADGRLSYRTKTPWRNGTTHMIFEPLELLEKLAVLVPSPRANRIRFHGL